MSKSKGTFVRADTYLKHLDPAYLRYYYASKLGSRLDDLDLNLDEFVAKVNADLVGKVVNLASRSARFVQDLGLSAVVSRRWWPVRAAARVGDEIAAAYDECDFNRAMRLVMELADRANPFVEAAEPWNLRKDPNKTQATAGCLHGGVEPVPPAGDLPCAGAAAAGRADRRTAPASRS